MAHSGIQVPALPCCRRYLERREWVVTAARLVWLLHLAVAAPAFPGADLTVAPSSLGELAGMARLTATDLLLALALLFPVRCRNITDRSSYNSRQKLCLPGDHIVAVCGAVPWRRLNRDVGADAEAKGRTLHAQHAAH